MSDDKPFNYDLRFQLHVPLLRDDTRRRDERSNDPLAEDDDPDEATFQRDDTTRCTPTAMPSAPAPSGCSLYPGEVFTFYLTDRKHPVVAKPAGLLHTLTSVGSIPWRRASSMASNSSKLYNTLCPPESSPEAQTAQAAERAPGSC